nr:replication initiation protein [Pseudodesulfovibrio sp.]
MKKIEIIKDNNYQVNKHKDLLLSQHKLSEKAQKIMSCLICMVKKDDEDFQEYKFLSKDFQELINSKSGSCMSDMIKTANELLDKKIKIDLGSEILLTHMVVSAKYEKSKGAYIVFKIHPELKPFFLNLKNNYLSYDIQNILSLKSNYSIRLYELLKHKFNQSAKHTKNPFITFSIEIDELRNMFQVPSSYNLHKIKTHILEKSLKEFSDKTDIFFKYTLTKEYSGKFDTINFSIGRNKI